MPVAIAYLDVVVPATSAAKIENKLKRLHDELSVMTELKKQVFPYYSKPAQSRINEREPV